MELIINARFRCIVEENADRDAFFRVLGELERLYPEVVIELPVLESENVLIKKFAVMENGFVKMIRISWVSIEGSVIVESDEYLKAFYDGKSVERIKEKKELPKNFKQLILFGTLFTVFNAVCCAAAWLLFGTDMLFLRLMLAQVLLTIVYTVFGKIKMEKNVFPLRQVWFVCFGGYTAIAALIAVPFVFAFTSREFWLVNTFGTIFFYFITVPFPCGISSLILFLIRNSKMAK